MDNSVAILIRVGTSICLEDDTVMILCVPSDHEDAARNCIARAETEWHADDTTESFEDLIERELKSARIPFEFINYTIYETEEY